MKALLFLLLLLPGLGLAQSASAPINPTCGCAQNFAELLRLTETNYAAYRDKVTPATRPRLDSLTRVLRARADTARSAASCAPVLRQWTQFFRDGHLGVGDGQGHLNADSVRAVYASAERLPWTRASFRAYLDDPAQPKRLLEGIWYDGGGPDYVVGIVADGPARYKGFVLRADSLFWTLGQVKFSFADPAAGPSTATYYMRNHSVELRPVQVAGDGNLDMNGLWYRAYPRPVAGPGPQVARHSFQMLDDTTALYRIASFDGSYRARIDSLTK
ncbi:MAG: hypothetical protein EOO36_22800, partial [Cytophagaceae bacterium]